MADQSLTPTYSLSEVQAMIRTAEYARDRFAPPEGCDDFYDIALRDLALMADDIKRDSTATADHDHR